MSAPTSPRAIRVAALARWALVALAALVAVGSWWSYLRAARPAAADVHAKYHCPMHPSVVSNEPGECPICTMALEPIASSRTAAEPPMSASSAPYTLEDAGGARFFCPMHPEVKSVDRGRCPICKMSLEPIPSGHPVPKHVAPISLALDRVQAIGVRTAVATTREASAVLRAPARVEAPEQGFSEVHVRTAGFIERMSVHETGVRVASGQALLALYSPEIWQAQADLLASPAVGSAVLSGDAGSAERTAERLGAAGRARLELLGMPPRAIDEVASTGRAMRAVPVLAPASGFVTKKNVVLGSYVTPETVLYEIQDLSRVYVIGDVFTSDAADAKVGAAAKLTVSGRPELETKGTIDLVYPRANVEARTLRVRMQVANDRMQLVPGQLGVLEVARAPRKIVVVPRDAIVDTGEDAYVFAVDVTGEEMRLSPRIVVLGPETGDDVEIVRGVEPGLRVVSGATFLVDSESRLRAALRESVGDAGP